MATTVIQLTRWTCDRCEATTEVPEGDENDMPANWACVAVSSPGPEEAIAYDLCPECSGKLEAFLKP